MRFQARSPPPAGRVLRHWRDASTGVPRTVHRTRRTPARVPVRVIFSRTCIRNMPPVSLGSEKHLPGFVALSDELKAAGAEVIACVSGVAAHVRVCRQ